MKIGKLPNELLDEIIIKPITDHNPKRSEILAQPSIGEDCCAISFGDNICVLSTDPITGAVNDIGKLAVNINSNDIASAGAEPIGILVTALLPPTITSEEISHIMKDFYTTAGKLNISVLGGHTEVTDSVVRPVLSCTVVGKTKSFISTGGCKEGDSLIMTKWAGLEGTSIIAKDYKDRLRVGEATLNKALELTQHLSVIKEGKIASQLGANAMHDVTEGGILGACWEMASCSGKGVTVYTDNISMLECTKEICDYIGINPLRLISSGSMLISTDKPQQLIDALSKENIPACVIAEITCGDMLIKNKEGTFPLTEPDCDELYKVDRLLKTGV